MKTIQEIQSNGLMWVDVSKQGVKELAEIQKRFGFSEQDIKESLPPYQRPKIVKHLDYYFMVLHFPIFDRDTKRLSFTEVDFFLSGSCLVTIHSSQLHVIEMFFTECRKNIEKQNEYFQGTAVHILFELVSRLLDSIFPILLHVNEDINFVDKKLFSQTPSRAMAEEILRLKTNVVTFRRTMQGHRTVLERLIMYSGHDLDVGSFQSYINNLREFTNEIWHMLESQKESINALHETNESLVNLRTNQVMKTLTIISVVTFPLTLFVAWTDVKAGGNFFSVIPGGFWLVTALMIIGGLSMVYSFKKKDWL
ncbi:MAG: magnesium transporter CorA family protein [Candidatus Magasanikbacteria bacterium]